MNNKEIQKLKRFPRWVRHFGWRKEALDQYRQMLSSRESLRFYLKNDLLSPRLRQRAIESFNKVWGNFLGVKAIDI